MATPSKAGFTAGPARVVGSLYDVSGDRLWCGYVVPVDAEYRGSIASIQSCAHIGGISNGEAAANAALIAETFTVASETGLTPRQLAERCKEFETALRLAAAQLAHYEPVAPAIRVAIAKTGGAV